MKNKKLVVQINKPVSEVFAFTINPQSTPKWIDAITSEQTNEMFVLTKKDGNYHVRYTFTPMGGEALE